MQIHHQKHHQTYVTNLNNALASQASAMQAQDIPALLSLQQNIKFNAGGHINHSIFWKNLSPPGSPATDINASAPTLKKSIDERWGSLDAFTDAFKKTLLALQGSGWGWLVVRAPGQGGASGKRLEIVTTKDQDPVDSKDGTPVFGVDMWEHAYYLQVCLFYFVLGWVMANEVVPQQQSILRRWYLEGYQLGYR